MRYIAPKRFSLILVVTALAWSTGLAPAAALTYPETRRVDQIDVYHGKMVADPYRWLENDVREDAEVAAWVEAENQVTFGYLKAIPQRQAIVDRLTELWNYERYSTPSKEGGRYYFSKNDGLQNQSVVYMLETLDSEPKVLFDPNMWSEDGTVALGETSFSKDGKYVAYSIADGGSDWRSWRIRDIASGNDLDDKLEWTKWSPAVWGADNAGFYYCRFDAPAAGAAYQQSNLNQKMYYHRVGTPQDDDPLIFSRPEEPKWGFSPYEIGEGSQYMALGIWDAGEKNLLYYMDLSQPNSEPKELIGGWDASYDFIGNDGPIFYIRTDLDAPNGRVVTVDIREPERANWKTIIPESEDALRGADIVGDFIITSYLHDAASRVRLFTLAGEHVRDVEFPGIGSAGGFDGRRGDTETFYTFTNYTTPPSIYRYDLATGQSTLFQKAKVGIDTDLYEVKQVFYTSKDGTRVPMFITHKKGLVLDGNNPTLLYGYGGFNAAMTPRFSVSSLAWAEMGGVYAVANLRGGGEYGEKWHQAGMKLNKQNVFDDFIAAAEWLIANKYTSAPKLAVQGGSNGGLLVGAVMTQRPDLFGACVPEVGVMDMLRFHKFTAGRYWTDDYGSSDDPEQFKALQAYSPYHNIKDGTKYPPTIVTTADTDDRVVPGHSFKFAAALQHAQAGDAPVIIRIETRAGHGAGTPTGKWIEHVADIWAFLCANLNVTLPAGNGAH